ncbi:MAG: enoyl-CoA hydratase/isomerase family protein [Acidobacteriota bacterium]
MKSKVSLATENEVFSSSLVDDILVIKQKQHILHLTQDINTIFGFYEYLESMFSSKAYKALAVFSHDELDAHLEHGSFLCKALFATRDNKVMDRLANVVNRLILTLSTLNGITVFAGQGKVSLFHLNLSLSYDYRIFAEDTVFENHNVGIGMITKGSGYYLPRLLGVKKATEILQWKSFSAEEALQLGLVDKIVPAPRLEQETFQFLKASLAGPSATLLAIRKLLKCDLKELQRTLELEDHLIKERLESAEFKKTFEEYCAATYGCDMETLRCAK